MSQRGFWKNHRSKWHFFGSVVSFVLLFIHKPAKSHICIWKIQKNIFFKGSRNLFMLHQLSNLFSNIMSIQKAIHLYLEFCTLCEWKWIYVLFLEKKSQRPFFCLLFLNSKTSSKLASFVKKWSNYMENKLLL